MGPNYYEYKPNDLFGFPISDPFARFQANFYAGNFGVALDCSVSCSAE